MSQEFKLQIRHAEILAISISMLIFLCGAAAAIVDPAFFHSTVIVEDGPLEWTTVFAIGIAAAVSLLRLARGIRSFSLMKKALLLAIVLLAVFGIGEEISWGQRLLGLETPQWFQDNNYQKELNLHNLVLGDVKFHKDVFPKALLAVFLIYLGLITPLYRSNRKFKALMDDWGVPIPKGYQIASYVAAIIIVEVLLKAATDGLPRRGELTEFIVSIIVALNIAFPRNPEVYSTEPT